MKITRLGAKPIITPELHESLGNNINGPSLIRVPSWVKAPLGRYYLYFAHHRGGHIRLAYADHLEGPWTLHAPGVLRLDESTCLDHVASPDVHVDESTRSIRMYFHGIAFADRNATDGHEKLFGEASWWVGNQRTKLATSSDGLAFTARPEPLGSSYFRVFSHGGWTYSLAMPGVFYRSRDGFSGFEVGPICFGPDFRHCAVLVRGDLLHVFHTEVGHEPERILHSTIDLRADWKQWRPTPANTVLEPATTHEGAGLPLKASVRGAVFEPVRELRDPALFEEDGRVFLLYSVAGENGIAIARIDF
ncbi:hypothetical protein [Variovorax rhizosphaerae]|uniref:Uncharacterized protein n=1 Tax=Variovorax rhizosphaerae TaxID=1836200 RepID=A0ABU8WXC7_9BURK